MNIKDYLLQDAYRIYKDNSLAKTLWRFLTNFSYRVRFQMSLLQYMKINNRGGAVFRFMLAYYKNRNYKYGVTLPIEVKIGAGVSFPHHFPIVINPDTNIGENCIIHPNVQIGTSRGKHGAPIIGNNCFLGNGCHIIGNLKIGDWVFVSPGAFVCKDIPSGCVVGFGINNIISHKGEELIRRYQSPQMIKYS